MNKQFLIVVGVVIAALVGVFALTSNKSDNGSSSGNVQPSNYVVGAGNKKVTLIEYGDFQCPACKAFYPIVKQVKETYGDDIKFQFRHFPLTQIHPNAFAAHRAAEAAGRQSKFFEMHDLLYEQQESWSTNPNPVSIFESFASQLGLNMDQYKADVASESVADVINADIKEAQAVGGNSTPTFVLNGQKIENPKTFEEFKKVIDEAIAKANP